MLNFSNFDNRKRIKIDRRSGEDRRQSYSLDYFKNGGIERRHNLKDRRIRLERRKGWVRVNDWYSVYVDWVKQI